MTCICVNHQHCQSSVL